MDKRQERAAQIVEAGGLQKRGQKIWLVPSQTHNGKWLVDYSTSEPTCSCPDYEARAAFCKHIFAVEIFQGRLAMSAPTPNPNAAPAKKRYTQNWAAYNAAQMNERAHFVHLLWELCRGVRTPVREGRGRPPTPLADAVFACVMKVYEGMSGRRATSEISRCADEGLIDKVVHYNTVSDYMKDPALTPLLRILVQETAVPLAGIEHRFAVDSTGFGTRTFDRWFDEKHGKAKCRQKFVKAHAICGTSTHIVTDMIVSPAGDATQFEELVDVTGQRFTVASVSADKAYSSRRNVVACGERGVVPYIPFRDGTKEKGSDLWRKMWHYYQYRREEFDAQYHDRSNVETLFSAVKAKLGTSLRSKSDAGQVNELYCKFIAYNITVLVSSIYELGLVPEFWRPTAEGAAGVVGAGRAEDAEAAEAG